MLIILLRPSSPPFRHTRSSNSTPTADPSAAASTYSGNFAMISGDENHQQDVVTDGQEQERGIQDTQNHKSDGAKVQEVSEEMAEQDVHASLSGTPPRGIRFSALAARSRCNIGS